MHPVASSFASSADASREAPVSPTPGGGGGGKAGRRERLRRMRKPRPVVDWDTTNLRELMDARHPAVVTTFGGVTLGGLQFVVQEHVANGSLFDLLYLNIVPLDIITVVDIALAIASGCRYLNEAKVSRAVPRRRSLVGTCCVCEPTQSGGLAPSCSF